MGAQNGKEERTGLDPRDPDSFQHSFHQQHLTRDQIHCQPRIAGIKQPVSRVSRDKSRDSKS